MSRARANNGQRGLFGWGRTLGCLGIGALVLTVSDAGAQPFFNTQPKTTFVPSGASVDLIVQASDPTASSITLQWKRNGVNIPGEKQTFSGPVAVMEYVFSAFPTNCGAYNVVASDQAGATESDIAIVLVTNIPTLPMKDAFGQTGTLGTNFFGVGLASNVGATVQSGEPQHGNEPGGASIWVRWTAPASGIATFSTLGSDFDTTLGVYTGSTFASLTSVAENDDDVGYLNSVVTFNTKAGTEYQIAVDGFYGVQGDIILNWALNSQFGAALPVILAQPQSVTAPLGGTVVLSVAAQTNGSALTYQWTLNGGPAPNSPNAPVLVLSNLTASQVGDYRVIIGAVGTIVRQASYVAHVQINVQDSNGSNPNAEAQDKFLAAIDPKNGFGSGQRPHAAPAGGYSGSQVFANISNTKEPGEPDPCGVPGGASAWYYYLPPANGMLTVDTTGTSFTNVLAVYTGTGASFSNLVQVACGTPPSGGFPEVAVFPVTMGTPYYIDVDSVKGNGGTVQVNYNLQSPPVITTQPLSQTVKAGSNVTLSVAVSGSPTLSFQWRTNTTVWAPQTASSATVNNFHAKDEGAYDVIVTNSSGGVTSSPAMLYLAAPLRFVGYSGTATGSFVATLLGIPTTNYVIESSTNLSRTNWQAILTNSSPLGMISLLDTNMVGYTNRFFRARVK